jgi:hypothetical protein
MQVQEQMRNVEQAESKTTKLETAFDEMLNTIEDSLSDLERSKDEEGEEDEDDNEDDTGPGKLREDDEPGWVMGTISQTVQYCMKSVWLNLMRLDELIQPGWGNAADIFCKRDMEPGTTELMVLAVVTPQTQLQPHHH